MSFSIRKFFSNLFVSIIVEAKECKIYGVILKNGKIAKKIETSFEHLENNKANIRAIEYIKKYEKECSYIYIALFFDYMSQGALPTTNTNAYINYGVDPNKVKIINMPSNWSIYANYMEMKLAKNILGNLQVDLLYSPFALLYRKLQQIGFSQGTTLYVYNHINSLALAIFEKDKMKFGAFFITATTDEIEEDERDLQQVDTSQIDELLSNEKELNSFEKLESLDKFDDIKDLDFQDINSLEDRNLANSISIFGRDMKAYEYIVSAIDEYYSNSLYDAKFLEKIVFFNNTKMSKTFLSYIESQLLLKIENYDINTIEIMNNLMIKEINI
ncbi:MAG: hypothetical protein SPI03_04295 [Campylobacter sputorum]|uniref:hypothetical protein n=1 Tax=Campylobacter sputorum TaxID=206 RepID=UPI000B77413A|nr:hypothetical protein [Campylobacter sputorum]ASM38811.1 hypothetical protein CSPARA_1257 [Campylobacter sputorum bv. paraureolyticus LMG 11764]MDY6120537.1 hypothetical protein [Campylobacter sputorum]